MEYTIPNYQFKNENQVLCDLGYQKGDELGSGGQGVVYRVKKDETTLACKVINLTNLKPQSFQNELQIHLRCNDHPNLIKMVDQFIINNSAYLIMEFADGGTMNQLNSYCGLFYMHQNRIAHRDLKLDNLLLIKSDKESTGYQVKIADFGLSVHAYKSRLGYIHTFNFAGTRSYMAPEIIRIRAFNDLVEDCCFDVNPFKSDIWSLGVCVFQLITFKLPFQSKDDLILLKMQENRRYSFPNECDASQDCRQLINEMLDPSVDSRIDPFGILHHRWLGEMKI
ncbi:hypothetical protein RDWZM_000951 [Blomia tropicalis]|uniref:Protein kinase domain-containing protein n=1 Tax=Blomia tropicalis TaxID=40697 RepID=A0A9Q0MAS2_BLOTA|nr:hypothetical protein RDWZM_000951 [Blomia tropicalis]